MFGKPFYRHLGNEYVSVCNYERIRIILPIIHLVKEENVVHHSHQEFFFQTVVGKPAQNHIVTYIRFRKESSVTSQQFFLSQKALNKLTSLQS